MANKDNKVDCFKCAHFVVTWSTTHPRACKLFGFKGLSMPSVTVKNSSGAPCEGFTPKNTKEWS